MLLVLHSELEGADEVTPAKLFEYMSVEKPILVLGPGNMEAARIVTSEKIGFGIDLYNEKEMLRSLQEIQDLFDQDKLPSYAINDLMHYSRQYQYAKLIDLIK